MYVEDGTDSTDHGADASADSLTVTVEGEDYQVDETYDVNHDGTNDTAIVEGDDGSSIAFTDVDGDHHADVAVELDAQGHVEGAARYDESTGEWVAVDPNTGQPTGGDTGSEQPTGHTGGTEQTGGTGGTQQTGHTGGSSAPSAGAGGEIRVDQPNSAEEYNAGQATVDLNQDGTADTAVEHNDDGTVIGYTDTNADGEADVVTRIDADGNVSVSQHTGEDQWTEVEKGHIDSQGHYTSESSGASSSLQSDSAPQGAATIDPATGQWVG